MTCKLTLATVRDVESRAELQEIVMVCMSIAGNCKVCPCRENSYEKTTNNSNNNPFSSRACSVADRPLQ